jgi:hypothetical protein
MTLDRIEINYFKACILACCYVVTLHLASRTGDNSRLITRLDASTAVVKSRGSCLSEMDLVNTVQLLSVPQGNSKLEPARRLLLASARESAMCRKAVVQAVMSGMDKPNLDLTNDPASYSLWYSGARLLADLKAYEALDLLIANLNVNDGTTMSPSHYPALGGVIRMGPVAIPKLGKVLRESPDHKQRSYAVFCIAQIGGRSAMRVLKSAHRSETDACVNRFIKVSIESLGNRRLPYQITSADRPRWFSAFWCFE